MRKSASRRVGIMAAGMVLGIGAGVPRSLWAAAGSVKPVSAMPADAATVLERKKTDGSRRRGKTTYGTPWRGHATWRNQLDRGLPTSF